MDTRARAGFSLIEMMITVLIFATVTIYLGEALTRQSRIYTIVDNLTETQQNLRAVGGLLETELLATGFLVPEGGAICGYDTATATLDGDADVLFLTAAEAIDPAGMNSLQLGASVTSGKPNFTAGAPVNIDLGTVDLDGNPFYDLDGDGAGDSDFLYTAAPLRQGGVIFVDRANPGSGTACGILTGINVAANSIQVDFTVNGSMVNEGIVGAVTDLVAIPAHGYWIQGLNPPVLMRDGIVFAQDVEDLQIALFYDLDEDGIVDGRPAGNNTPPYHSTTEYPGSAMLGSEYVPGSGNWDNALLQEVRITLIARTRMQDPDVLLDPALAQGQPQSYENMQPFAGVPDGFRRRTLTFTVDPRNVGNRTSGF